MGTGEAGGWVGTDEVAGDRVRGVDRKGRGEAGQEAEEGDKPEFSRLKRKSISSGSNGRRPVVSGCWWWLPYHPTDWTEL